MNYGILGSVGKGHVGESGGYSERSGRGPLAKEMLAENRRRGMSKKQIERQQYMDKMKASLNDCVARNIAPYWRNHQSLKGKYQR